ncbi:carboxypeptidase regulatory-like domain-containing protein [Streptomyces sp. NPDC001978]|uniref:carboxypeptidase regulatory-like domain-containing protein n=1 Tax=Streptomyces sp. NPDC001978 TaxID=3364627 RepID=UPI0036A4860D
MTALADHADNSAASTTPTASTTPVEHVCSTPKPGEFGCFALRRTGAPGKRAQSAPDFTPSGYGPADLQSAYNLSVSGGSGRTVAIVDANDDPTAEADLAAYRAQFGLPPCTTANGCFTKVSQRGGTDYPQPDEGWAGEISLDLDMVSATAPDAKILLVEADSPTEADLGAAVDEAVALGAKFVSNSYGTDYTEGDGEDPSETTALDPHYNHPGVAMVASSGDYGFGVSYPAASQYVTAAGGTSLVKDSTKSRGWSESAWSGAGSGCSLYEPKPAFQQDSGCANRSVADVSAVADPETGVAVYQTFGGNGWAVYGGTSASAPIIASVYAVAGEPTAGTYPNSYPYQHPSALNDVTAGDNGFCSPTYLCSGQAGYDGPTGLGTPNGADAFRSGPHGVVSGTVTNSATGAPIAGATVSIGDHDVTTDAHGNYALNVPIGTYTVTASAYGYASKSVTGVSVADGATVSENFSLASVPSHTVSGTVTDGSGHGWPLYAKITVDGAPGGPVFTNPTTGKYSLQLAQGRTYTLHVSSAYSGYQTGQKAVTVDTRGQAVFFALPVDRAAEIAPGYAVHWTGATQTFDSPAGAPDGWSVVDAPGTSGGWTFDDPGHRGNHTGGSGGFAIADDKLSNPPASLDSQLISPAYDLTAAKTPYVAFDTDQQMVFGRAEVDATIDNGVTWTNVWKSPVRPGLLHVEVSLTQYAGRSGVRLRFHSVTSSGWWWAVDNVRVGNRSYDPVHGGLVTGIVADANTGTPVVGAKVTSQDAGTDSALTAATPDDPRTPDGFYWMFSSVTGKHDFSAAKPYYATGTEREEIRANAAVQRDFRLKAGRLSVTQTSVDATAALGGRTSAKLTLRNRGSAPTTVTITEHPATLPMLQRSGAPLKLIKETSFSPLSARTTAKRGTAVPDTAPKAGAAQGTAGATATGGQAWQSSADLPTTLEGNLADTFDGRLYTGFGWNGRNETKALYSYDPKAGEWSTLASAADAREMPAHGFIGDKLYVAGGWGSQGTDHKLEIYDPHTDHWTVGAPLPKAYGASASAVLDDKLYVVGGCYQLSCAGVTDVMAYDPHTDSWSQAAPYPEPISWSSCGAIRGKLYCAGGLQNETDLVKHAYVYDPGTDKWSQIADLPNLTACAAYSAANGQLLVSGGLVGSSFPFTLTNQGYAYSPDTNAWTALPNANAPVYRAAGARGFYVVGGWQSGKVLPPPVKTVSVLPGYAQDASVNDVDWLSENPKTVTIAPGHSTTVTVTLDAAAPSIVQPGNYTAALSLGADTPYPAQSIPVTLHVGPSVGWGRIAGTVRGSTGHGHSAPLAGATVDIHGRNAAYTLTTASDGTYSLWLPARNNPAMAHAAKEGVEPADAHVHIKEGGTARQDFTLKSTA